MRRIEPLRADGLKCTNCSRTPAVGKTLCQTCLDGKRTIKLARRYGITPADYDAMWTRQRGRCPGCRVPLSDVRPNIDHDHSTGKVRAILCHRCNVTLGFAKEDPATLRRLIGYLTMDPGKQSVYVAGSLRNPRIVEVGNLLRSAGYDAQDEWFSGGPRADDHWKEYEQARGRSYRDAIKGRAAQNIFLFDQAQIDLSDAFVLVLPAGKSAHMELGRALGNGIPTVVLQDEGDERYEVMPGLADYVCSTTDELLRFLGEALK